MNMMYYDQRWKVGKLYIYIMKIRWAAGADTC